MGAQIALILCILFGTAVHCPAQQKAQWVPGQYGLNVGVLPDPGFTYQNLAVNYSASRLNDSNGNALPGLSGNYQFWLDENIFMYVPKFKNLGGYLAPFISVNLANGSLVADLVGTSFRTNAGAEGLADTVVQPVTLRWKFSRVDQTVGYVFTAPTGRYVAGANDNVSSGYWGNNLNSGTTRYLTKNKGTSANIFSDWETHSQKERTNIKPGQAFTMEWGLGQAIPLDKDLRKLIQVGLVGYDQWQVTDNSGITSLLPYSVHALGVQANFIATRASLSFFFKYYNEYDAKARPKEQTFVFGGSWTLKTPRT